MSKLSVITPIYQSGDFLEPCLKSLVTQSLGDLELIWIDNGSDERCKKIISAYEALHKNVRVVRLEKNIGYGGAMNVGLEIAGGEYIGFCDSDDWVDPDYFEKLYGTAKKNDADIAYACYLLEYGDKAAFRCRHLTNMPVAATLCEKFAVAKNGAVWDKIFKRALFVEHEIRFPAEPQSYYQDNITLMQALTKANAVSLTDDAGYHYRQVADSTLHAEHSRPDRMLYAAGIINRMLRYALDNNFTLQEQGQFLKFVIRSLPVQNIIRKNKACFKHLAHLLPDDCFFMRELNSLYNTHHPSLREKLFCIRETDKHKIIWLMGIKIKIKKS